MCQVPGVKCAILDTFAFLNNSLLPVLDLDDVNHCGFSCLLGLAVPVGRVGLLLHVVRETGRQGPTINGSNVRDFGSAVNGSLGGVPTRFACQQLFSRQDQLPSGNPCVAIAVGNKNLLIGRD